MIELLLLRIKILIAFIRDKSEFILPTLSAQKNIYVFLGADYGNIGDVAITYAQVKFLKEHYTDYNVIEIPISRTYAGIKAVKRIISDDDIITLIGGGNTSDLYDDIEWLRQLVIFNFRKYKIIGFPQTFDFSETIRGKMCKCIASFIYRRAKKITIIAREQNTMHILNTEFKGVESTIAPDIVMTLDLRNNEERRGVLVCMRSDKEKLISDEEKLRLIQRLERKYSSIDYQDTQVDNVNMENRFTKLQEIINKFRCHELVITDRLHGMILCYITGTPALVYDNSNHKISACFHWIKDCGYIKMIESRDDIDAFKPEDHFNVSNASILKYYKNVLSQNIH